MILTPYGDPNAHGTLGKTLIFQRRRGGVFVKPYKIPKDPKTSGQLAQRQLFVDASKAWFAISSQSRNFYNLKAYGTPQTGYNLFISTFLLNLLPSTSPLLISDVEGATLGFTRSTFSHGWKHTLTPDPAGGPYGSIWDNENIFSDGAVYTPARISRRSMRTMNLPEKAIL